MLAKRRPPGRRPDTGQCHFNFPPFAFRGLPGQSAPVRAQLVVGVGDFDAHGFVSLQSCRENGGPRPAEGVEDPPTGDADLHQVPHELQRLFSDMGPVLGVGVSKHPRQASHRAIDGEGSVGTPDDILTLLAKAPLLRAAGQLVPTTQPRQTHPAHCRGIGDGGVLSPVDKQAHRRSQVCRRGGRPIAIPPPSGSSCAGPSVPVKIGETGCRT